METVGRADRWALCLCLCLTLACTETPLAGERKGYLSSPFAEHEIIRYKVRWGPIHLASLSITQERMGSSGAPRHLVRMSGETRPGLPFIDLIFANRAVLLPDYPTTRDFAFETGRGSKTSIAYRYDGARGVLAIERTDAAGTERKCLPHQGPLYDAGGIVMMIRCLSGSGMQCGLPTIVDQEIRLTRLTFTDDVKIMDCAVLGGTVRVRRVTGNADWATSSVAGLTGAFDAWLTDDERAIPVRASVRIAIGSVVLDLESFERSASSHSIALGGRRPCELAAGATP